MWVRVLSKPQRGQQSLTSDTDPQLGEFICCFSCNFFQYFLYSLDKLFKTFINS